MACPVCGKEFFSGRYAKYNLKRHLRIHAGEKPFACPYCQHPFNQKYNLHKHLFVCKERPPYDHQMIQQPQQQQQQQLQLHQQMDQQHQHLHHQQQQQQQQQQHHA